MKKITTIILACALMNGFSAAVFSQNTASADCKTVTVKYHPDYVRRYSSQIGNRASMWYTPCGKSYEVTERFRDGALAVTLEINPEFAWIRLGPEGSTMNFLNERLSRQHTEIECGIKVDDNSVLVMCTGVAGRLSKYWNCRIIN